MSGHTHPRGFTLTDSIAAVAGTVVLLALLIPALGSTQEVFMEAVSANNLRTLGQMHASYAADWDGRQWTVTPDDLSERTRNYRSSYDPSIAPPVGLGFNCEGEFHQTSRGWAIQPMWWTANCSLGNFRAWNTKPFNDYANGKVYDRMFWAPKNLAPPIDLESEIGEYLDLPCEWPEGASFWFPTYCMSVSAQLDPRVFASDANGGPTHPLELDFGHRTPNLAAARYPDLKTHMLEHYWLNPLSEDPFIPGTGDVPWFFNMSPDSEPIGLLFDGSVRKVPVMESLVSNDIVVRQGGDSLWQDDPGCFGDAGYLEMYGEPNIPFDHPARDLVDSTSSYHVFTADGILGRDTIFSK